ncbi:cupin domain-containing protein [Pseudomonas gingeri]|uniref:Cupin domain-containing protein n=1 Tax=Pseudomonas gingeri TaxID=117681 RepID=A0A7Y8C1S4_9PSED|nr:cupin domain-containing protein [Pseudomonas gingeri]NWB96810.1 cupin domain-containing protein [Pseudomonas gingeri]
MELNSDHSRRTLVQGAQQPWRPSPVAGVERRMLYRQGEEQARATSLVRYAPGSRFTPHAHPGGEEFLVLEGTFEDERGHYPAGTYVRNPPGSQHAPASASGCVIFVRLQQFAAGDTLDWVAYPSPPSAHRLLFSNRNEEVSLQTWAAGTAITLENEAGIELLVLSGSLMESGDTLQIHAWLRLPGGVPLRVSVGDANASVWIKQTHAPDSTRLPK